MENYLQAGIGIRHLNDLCLKLAVYDSELVRHCYRVGNLAALLARELHFTQCEIDCMQTAGICHDYGKIKIPKSIIFKREGLTAEERVIVETHVQEGLDCLQQLFKPSLILVAIAEHHERLDGTGYPNGVSDISSYGRILSVCDVFDALVHSRRYKEAISVEKAFSIIEADVGTKFDGRVVNALYAIIKENKLHLYDNCLHTYDHQCE